LIQRTYEQQLQLGIVYATAEEARGRSKEKRSTKIRKASEFFRRKQRVPVVLADSVRTRARWCGQKTGAFKNWSVLEKERRKRRLFTFNWRKREEKAGRWNTAEGFSISGLRGGKEGASNPQKMEEKKKGGSASGAPWDL